MNTATFANMLKLVGPGDELITRNVNGTFRFYLKRAGKGPQVLDGEIFKSAGTDPVPPRHTFWPNIALDDVTLDASKAARKERKHEVTIERNRLSALMKLKVDSLMLELVFGGNDGISVKSPTMGDLTLHIVGETEVYLKNGNILYYVEKGGEPVYITKEEKKIETPTYKMVDGVVTRI